MWLGLFSLLVIAGSAGSIVAAGAVAHAAGLSEDQQFATSSADIAANLQLGIQHELDLVVSEQTFVLGDPGASEAEFAQWVDQARVMDRYPELLGIGSAQIVPAAQLAAFETRPTLQSANGHTPSGTFAVVPAGNRAFYCLAALGFDRTLSQGLPRGFDLCAGPQGRVLLAARDSGRFDVQPTTSLHTTTLSFSAPTYAGGVVPPTVAQRRASFVGWVGMSISPHVLLVGALRGHPDTAVTLRYGSTASRTYFRNGAAFHHPQVATVDIQGGWTILVSRPADGEGIVSNPTALALLVAGVVVSLLLGLLVYVLGMGRARATQWAHEQTGQLRHQTLHDSLTGLPNRALTFDRIEQMLARFRRTHTPYAVLFLDLDDFKDINDTLGHQAGDQLLVAVGQRLTASLRESETVGRLGGDEFVILLEGDSLTTGVEVPAQRILAVLKPTFDIAASPLPLSVSASIGVAMGEDLTPGELLRDADIALYQAKANGKGCCAVFTDSMQIAAQDHRHLSVDLHGALEADQFFLAYQPTFDLETNALVGVEALLRWRHPERGVVQPNEFIPALEASGLIVNVGAWVLDTACRQGARWQAEGHRFTIAVNVAASQLARDRVVDDVQRALGRSGFDPEMLVLEMTETALMSNIDEAVARLKILKALGVRLAVDDFGTGYSSLAYLREFPIDILKIDRSFVSEIGYSEESAALVQMLVQLGKSLGLEIIAEGIEDDVQRRWLLEREVDTGQGFLFSRPLGAGAVNRLLEELGTSAGELKAPTQGRPFEVLHGQQTLWSGTR